MKKSNICPKCGSNDILMIPGSSGAYGVGNNIPLFFSYVKVNRYLCCTCGFSEEWIDEKDIGKLKEKFR